MGVALGRSGGAGGGALSLPNLISLARLLSVPLAVYLVLEADYGWAFTVFLLAGLSDAVDGLVAKRFGQTSALGAYLDPLADKALLVGVYVALGVQDAVPMWLVIIVVFRDILIVGGVLLLQLVGQPARVRPLLVSKVNTAAQISLAAIVLAERAFAFAVEPVTAVAVWAVAATTVGSGAAYVIAWMRYVEPMDG